MSDSDLRGKWVSMLRVLDKRYDDTLDLLAELDAVAADVGHWAHNHRSVHLLAAVRAFDTASVITP